MRLVLASEGCCEVLGTTKSYPATLRLEAYPKATMESQLGNSIVNGNWTKSLSVGSKRDCQGTWEIGKFTHFQAT